MRTINIHRPVSSLVFAWLLAAFLALSPLLTPVVQAQEPVTLVQTLASTSHCGTINSNQTWSNTGNVHVITCDVTVAFGVTLTIDEGTIVKFNTGTALLVQGTLRIVGTSANPVYLTSIKDDTVGGDTNNDGSNTLPAGGDWIEVRFAESSNDANSLIDHAEVRYSGGSRCFWFSESGATSQTGFR